MINLRRYVNLHSVWSYSNNVGLAAMFVKLTYDTEVTVGNLRTVPSKHLLLEDILVLAPQVFIWEINFVLTYFKSDLVH
jgi:hypothetical protein